MKRASWILFALALVLSVPAFSQGGADGKKMKDRVEALEELTKKQAASIATLEGYVRALKAEGTALTAALKKAEKEGFLYPAPNIDAKKSLLSGLKSAANTMTGTAAK